MKWPFSRKTEPLEAFVVCDKGVPAVVIFDSDNVRKEITKRKPKETQIHKVPVIMGTS
jgi:hypothetical protein